MVLEKTLESPLDSKEINQSILKEIGPGYSLEGSCFPRKQDKGYDTGSAGQRYHVKLSLSSVDVTSGQSDWLWGGSCRAELPMEKPHGS